MNSVLLRVWQILQSKEMQTHVAFSLLASLVGFLLGKFENLMLQPEAHPVTLRVGLLVTVTAVIVLGHAVYIWHQMNKVFRLEYGLDLGQFELNTKGAQTVRVLNTFVPDPESVAEILVKAASNNAKVCLLLLGPKTREARLRANSLRETDDDISTKILATLEAVEKSLNRIQGTKPYVQVRLCKVWVPFSLYATENVAHVGYFLVGELAVRGPQLVVKKYHPQFSTFERQFQALWDHRDTSADLPMLDREGWRRQVRDHC